MSQALIRVMIADDHPVVRAGLEAIVSVAPEIEVTATASTAEEAVAQVQALQASATPLDVVLMDLRFGEKVGSAALAGGVTATQRIRALPEPRPQVLVVTNYSTDGDVVGAVSAGAVGYLLKDCDPDVLVEAIHKAARGETVMSTQVMGKLFNRVNNPVASLTRREIDVLRLADQGKTNKFIARELVLTEATVKSHMGHIFTKLGVKNRTSAIAVARERGII